jgi:RNA polymerase sigma-70 factor, ECF subfamily
MSNAVSKGRQSGITPLSPSSTLVDESALAVRAGTDPSSLAMLYEAYFPRIHKYVLYRVQDMHTADDLVSQIFEQMLNTLKSYRPDRAPFGAWLFGIARHVVGDHFRLVKRQPSLHLGELLFHPLEQPSSEEAAVQSEHTDRLLKALESLSERERDLIAMKFAAGFTNRQIAALSGMSESNVGIILYRTIRRLRSVLVEKEVGDD